MRRTRLVTYIPILLLAARARAAAKPAVVAAPPAGQVDAPYSFTFTAAGGTPPYAWSANADALPPGLSLTASGVLAGTPERPGAFHFAVRVEDARSVLVAAGVDLAVQPAPLSFAANFQFPSGVAGFEYHPQILDASGGAPPYVFAIPAAALPPGLSLKDNVVSGTPTAAGSYPVPVTVTDSAGAAVTGTFPLVVRVSNVDLTFSAANVSFTVHAGATATPSAARVTAQSSSPGTKLSYSCAPAIPAPWISVETGGSTPDVLSIGPAQSALALPAGTYTAPVACVCASAQCSGKSQQISVQLTVTAAAPRLGIKTGSLSFTATPATPTPAAQLLTIENTGGGSLGVQSVTCGAAWCSVSGAPAAILPGAPAEPVVAANPAGLAPGLYQSSISIVTSVRSASVPIALRVAPGSISLEPAGARFRMNAGGLPGNPNGTVALRVSAANPVNWTATVAAGSGWLRLGASAGTLTPGVATTLAYSIDPAAAALAPGDYYGAIRIAAAGVNNSPRDYRVVLTVAASNAPAIPDPQPGGLLFAPPAGGVSLPQNVLLYSASKNPVGFTTGVSASGNWLSASPASGTVSAASPATVTVAADPTGLTPGQYRGEVNFALAGAAVRTVQVTLLVVTPRVAGLPPAAGDESALAIRPMASANCAPSSLAPAQTGLAGNFSTAVGWPVAITVQLLDNCGGAVANGQLAATFSNGDPPIPLALADASSGSYSATWVPGRSASQVTITVRAAAAGLAGAAIEIAGGVTQGEAPAINPGAVLHIFDPHVGAPLAPGTVVQIYGDRLAPSAAAASTIPLPTSLNGVSLIVGGLPAPLYYVGPGQIDAQLPFELTGTNQYQAIVVNNNALSAPAPFETVPVEPGIAVLGDGSANAQHADGTSVTAAAPAVPGETIVLYLAGMGLLDETVSTGAGSPVTPLAHPAVAPAVTVGGVAVTPSFAGLTPGLVGLYQINLAVPQGLRGSVEIAVGQAGRAGSTVLLPMADTAGQ